MAIALRGIIHGNTIEVREVVQPAQPDEKLEPGEGIPRSFGGWCDDIEGLDKYLEWNRQQRKRSRRNPLDELSG
jgi:hypothetical protein